VPDPEATDRRVGVGQGESIGGERMGEAGRVEIEPHAPVLAPIDPGLELGDGVAVAVESFGDRIGVGGVEVEAVGARDAREGVVEIGPEFGGCARFARVIPGGLDASAGEGGVRLFESADVVALPAVERDRCGGKRRKSRLGIDSEQGVGFTGECVRGGHAG